MVSVGRQQSPEQSNPFAFGVLALTEPSSTNPYTSSRVEFGDASEVSQAPGRASIDKRRAEGNARRGRGTRGDCKLRMDRRRARERSQRSPANAWASLGNAVESGTSTKRGNVPVATRHSFCSRRR